MTTIAIIKPAQVNDIFAHPPTMNDSDFDIFNGFADSALASIYNPHQNLPTYQYRLEQEPELRTDIGEICRLLADWLENNDSVDGFLGKLNSVCASAMELLSENASRYAEQTLKERTELITLKKAFEEGKGGAMIFPYQRGQLSQYLPRLEYLLKQAFGKWRMTNSPSHMAAISPVLDPSDQQYLLKIAKNTLVLFFNSIPAFSNMEGILTYMQNNPIVSSDPSSAFRITLATHGKLTTHSANYVENEANLKPLIIPIHALLLAQIAAGDIGANVSNEQGSGAQIAGVVTEYDDEEADADTLQKHGLIQVAGKRFMGTCTANQSSVKAYGNYTSMDVWIMVQRSLAEMAKKTKFSDWDSEKEEAFVDGLLTYFRSLWDLNSGRRVLAEAVTLDDIEVIFDEATEKVKVRIDVKYKGISKAFSFLLKSKKGRLGSVKAKV